MPDVVKAKCPHCQNVLRLPVAWLGQSLRCKHCQKTIHLKPKPAPPPAIPAVKTGTTPPLSEAVKPARPAKSAPVRPAPTKSAGSGSPFEFDDLPDEPAPVRKRPADRRPGNSLWKGALLGGCVVVLVAVLAVLFGSSLLKPGTTKNNHPQKESAERSQKPILPPDEEEDPFPAENPEPAKNKTPEIPKKKVPKVETPPVVQRDPFPRRALLIGVSNYLYANAVPYGKPATDRYPGASTGALRKHFTTILHVPANQAAELSDRGTPPRSPVKETIEATVRDFLKSCRGQDRIVLLFAGHAVEIDKEAYLVPQEGDPDDADKLIAFKWLYDRLGECKARQKVLIVDVCRLDPVRGKERAGGEPMGDVLNLRLSQAPAGVQVWSACSPKQQSYEIDGGSVFLAGLCHALKAGLTIQSPGDPLPLDMLLPRVNAHLDRVLSGRKLQQVSRLNGREADGGDPYNVAEAPPPPVRVLAGPAMKGNFANRVLIASIVKEINAIPTSRAAKGNPSEFFPPDGMPPFPAAALKGYEADYASLDELKKIVAGDKNRYPLRAAALEAMREMNDSAQKFAPRPAFSGNVNDALKKQIHAEQRAPGHMIASLETALAALEKAGKDRANEPSKRWQANFDYTMTRLKARLVMLYEYNNLLAQIRGDALPPLTDGTTGYLVSPRKKVQVPEGVVKTWVKEITGTWTKIIREHPNTPWAVMARREQANLLGLEWRPYRP